MSLLLDEDAPDVEDFVSCWLQPLLRAGIERKKDDPWPFALVQRIDGSDSPESGLDDPVVQIDVLYRAVGPDVDAAAGKIWANKVHRRMTKLGVEYPDVTLSDGSVSGLDYLRVLRRMKREPFGDDMVVRYVARYALGLSYVAA
ncbi:hypothetical protein [Mycolicibacterium sp. A43C]